MNPCEFVLQHEKPNKRNIALISNMIIKDGAGSDDENIDEDMDFGTGGNKNQDPEEML